MKSIQLKSIVIFLFFLFSLSFAANPIAVVVKSKGSVKIKNNVTGKTSKVKRGCRIYSGDKIVTGKKGRLALRFIDDKSLVRIRPNSTCTIKGKKEKNSIVKNLYVEVGTIFSKITKSKSRFQVSTPTSVASVKGTIFWTKQEYKGGTYYFGEEGVIEISNKSGSALLNAGYTGYVKSGQTKPKVYKTKPGEKPVFDDEDTSIDDFEIEFQNKDGGKKTLKFKTKKKN